MLRNNQNLIRSIYKRNHGLIMQRRGVDPYFLNWEFTPIEDSIWSSIRFWGIPLYPEYPVLKYFVDFGNPYFKIGIETDGKDFHNAVKDKERDEELYKNGWRIFRVTGTEALREFYGGEEYEKFCQLEITEEEYWDRLTWWLLNTGDGVVYALHKFYIWNAVPKEEYWPLIYQTLSKHNLLDFPLV